MRNSVKIALCGVMAALSTVIMFLSGVIPSATVALPALAGCMLIPVTAELNIKWGFAVFAVCAVISFLTVPDREASLIYLLFFGYYPVLYGILGRISNKTVRVAVKLIIFNVAAILESVLTICVLGIPWENIGFLGKATAPVLLILANIVFILYDRALGGLIAMYFLRFHDTVRKYLR